LNFFQSDYSLYTALSIRLANWPQRSGLAAVAAFTERPAQSRCPVFVLLLKIRFYCPDLFVTLELLLLPAHS
jgi:hypothetical protein